MSRTIKAEDALIACVLKYMKWPEGRDYWDTRSEFLKIGDRLYVEIDRESVQYAEQHHHWSVELKKALDEPTKVVPISEALFIYVTDHLRWAIERLDVVTDREKDQLIKAFIPQMTYEEYAVEWAHRNNLTDTEMTEIYEEQIAKLQREINDVIRINSEKMAEFERLIEEKKNGKA